MRQLQVLQGLQLSLQTNAKQWALLALVGLHLAVRGHRVHQQAAQTTASATDFHTQQPTTNLSVLVLDTRLAGTAPALALPRLAGVVPALVPRLLPQQELNTWALGGWQSPMPKPARIYGMSAQQPSRPHLPRQQASPRQQQHWDLTQLFSRRWLEPPSLQMEVQAYWQESCRVAANRG